MPAKFFIIIFTASLLLISSTALAEEGILKYGPIDGKMRYTNKISIQYVTDTDKIHAATTARISNTFNSKAVQAEDKLLVKVEFDSITLDEFKREIRISDNEKRLLGSDLAALEAELKSQVQEKWIAVIIDEHGQLFQQFYSPSLEELKLVDLRKAVEYLYIPLPEEKVAIGSQWKERYAPTVIPFSGAIPLETTVKYTYLGTEMQNGVQCYKINARLNLIEEKPIGEYQGGITWVSYIGSGLLYFAVQGNYLVKSNFTGDLSFMVLADVEDEGSYVSFIRSKVEQSIELLNE